MQVSERFPIGTQSRRQQYHYDLNHIVFVNCVTNVQSSASRYRVG